MALSVSEALPVTAPRTRRQIWSIGGGKGGIGKSLLAASVGWQLARMGRRVVLVDADLGERTCTRASGCPRPPGLSPTSSSAACRRSRRSSRYNGNPGCA